MIDFTPRVNFSSFSSPALLYNNQKQNSEGGNMLQYIKIVSCLILS